jgi:hypothetical protein
MHTSVRDESSEILGDPMLPTLARAAIVCKDVFLGKEEDGEREERRWPGER